MDQKGFHYLCLKIYLNKNPLPSMINVKGVYSSRLDSDRQMVLATRAHLVKNEMLKEEEVECRELYENILRKHLIDEKNQRARR